MSVRSYIDSSIEELKKIQWPTKKEATRLTVYVVGVSLGVGLFVLMFDFVFKEILTLIL